MNMNWLSLGNYFKHCNFRLKMFYKQTCQYLETNQHQLKLFYKSCTKVHFYYPIFLKTSIVFVHSRKQKYSTFYITFGDLILHVHFFIEAKSICTLKSSTLIHCSATVSQSSRYQLDSYHLSIFLSESHISYYLAFWFFGSTLDRHLQAGKRNIRIENHN